MNQFQGLKPLLFIILLSIFLQTAHTGTKHLITSCPNPTNSADLKVMEDNQSTEDSVAAKRMKALIQSTRLYQEGRTTWNDLPDHVIEQILSKLPLPHLFECRYISQNFRMLINERNLAKMHFWNSSKDSRLTSLLVKIRRNLYAIPNLEKLNSGVQLKNLPLNSCFPMVKIIGSCNGLLYVADDMSRSCRIFFVNPVSGDSQLLPDGPVCGDVGMLLFGFGYHPKLEKFMVIRLRCFRDESMIFDMHTLGTASWRSVEVYGNSSIIGSLGRIYGVFVNGNMHWFCIDRYLNTLCIGAFDIEKGEIYLLSLPYSFQLKPADLVYMGELGGFLTAAYVSPTEQTLKIWQMKSYRSWTIEYDIPRPICCRRSCTASAQLQPITYRNADKRKHSGRL